MILVRKVVGGVVYTLPVEATLLARNLWLVRRTVRLITPRTKVVYARNGDLLLHSVRDVKGKAQNVYGVYDLATARRAGTIHISDTLATTAKCLDYWIPKLGELDIELTRWNDLSESDRKRISVYLSEFVGAFWGVKQWQKAIALEKVAHMYDLTDRNLRRNPDGARRAIRSARGHLMEYRRRIVRELGNNGQLARYLENVHRQYADAYKLLRRNLQLGLPADESKAGARLNEIKDLLARFRINPWVRPAQEARRFVRAAEKVYLSGNRKEANRILRSIPSLFSAESVLTRMVEKIHRILDLGEYPEGDDRTIASSLSQALLEQALKLSLMPDVGHYTDLSLDILDLIVDARCLLWGRKERGFRKTLHQLEDRIRARG